MEDRETLLQEDHINSEYGEWKVLVICQLLNRANWIQVKKVLARLLEKWPSPEKMAFMTIEEIEELKVILKPLGFYKSRYMHLLKMSLMYVDLKARWDIRFDVTMLPGCGEYAADAWKLFVLKEGCHPKDRLLKKYAQRSGLWKEVEHVSN